MRAHALDPGHQSPNRQQVVSEGAGDLGYRALVNICKAVGRLDIAVFKHCNLISLSQIHLTFFSPQLTPVVFLLTVRLGPLSSRFFFFFFCGGYRSLFNMRYFLWVQLHHRWTPSFLDTRECVYHFIHMVLNSCNCLYTRWLCVGRDANHICTLSCKFLKCSIYT